MTVLNWSSFKEGSGYGLNNYGSTTLVSLIILTLVYSIRKRLSVQYLKTDTVGTVRRGPDRIGLLGKPPSSTAFVI